MLFLSPKEIKKKKFRGQAGAKRSLEDNNTASHHRRSGYRKIIPLWPTTMG